MGFSLPLDHLPQHGLLVQAVHDSLDVVFGLGCGFQFSEPCLNQHRLHPRDAGCSPLRADSLDDAEVGDDCRIAHLTVLEVFTGPTLLDFHHAFVFDKPVKNGVEGRLHHGQGRVLLIEFEHESFEMPFCGGLRGNLVEAQKQGSSLVGYGVLVAVLPSPLIVCPRNLAQGPALKTLPSELQGFAPVQSRRPDRLYLSLFHDPAKN